MQIDTNLTERGTDQTESIGEGFSTEAVICSTPISCSTLPKREPQTTYIEPVLARYANLDLPYPQSYRKCDLCAILGPR
jgi:hypothetical protein